MPVGEFDYAKLLVPVYLNLYDQAQSMLKRFNPCNVCDGVCERARRNQGNNFCCAGCVYLGANGCQVKALQCSLWVCRYDLIHENNRRAFDNAMWGIMIDANEHHLLVARGSMEDSIAQACRYYIEHRDERSELERKAKEYVPRPCFFPPAEKPKPPTIRRGWTSYFQPSYLKEEAAKIVAEEEKPAPVEEKVAEVPSSKVTTSSTRLKDGYFKW